MCVSQYPLLQANVLIRFLRISVTAGLHLYCLLYILELFPCTSTPRTLKLRTVVYMLTFVAGVINLVLTSLFMSHLNALTRTANIYTYGQRVTHGPGTIFINDIRRMDIG